MKLLLTSAGITNPSIAKGLYELLRKPIENSNVVIVPTAQNVEQGDKTWIIEEDFIKPYALGWGEVSIVDLAAVTSLDKGLWWPQFERADVILFGGGNAYCLSYWMQASGLFKVMPEWLKTKVYVGISAGSQVAGESLRVTSESLSENGEFYDDGYKEFGPKGQSSNKTLQLVDFVFRPHLNSPDFPKIREELLDKVVTNLGVPMYATDDQTALKIVDDRVEIISEGKWRLFNPR